MFISRVILGMRKTHVMISETQAALPGRFSMLHLLHIKVGAFQKEFTHFDHYVRRLFAGEILAKKTLRGEVTDCVGGQLSMDRERVVDFLSWQSDR